MILLPLLAMLTAGCGGGGGVSAAGSATSDLIFTREQAAQHGAWTVLVYLDADNDLESAGINNFNQMEKVGSTKDSRIIVQIDRKEGYDTTNGDWTGTRRYLITRDTNTQIMASVRLDDPALGEKDMANTQTLRDFVEWGMQNFPADHYCLVLWDHGSGWEIRSSSILPQYKYIIADDTSYSGMNVTQIPQALEGLHMDVIAFDACMMQQLEVAYQMRNSADYMTGSAAPEPSSGYNYSTWLAHIGSTTSPVRLCQTIVDRYAAAYPAPYQGITQSAIDLGRISNVADAASSFAQALISSGEGNWTKVKTARESALDYSVCANGIERYSLDLIDYAYKCNINIGTAQIQSAYTDLQSAVSDAIIAETHNPDTSNAHGLAIYVPSPRAYDSRYLQLDLAQDTSWDEWLDSQLY
ncbi:MAG: clostripain-related cysteine peptidase [Armatimonadota bacterium]